MAQIQGYADPEVYRKGRMLTLAGKIIGRKIEALSAMEYVYPLVDAKRNLSLEAISPHLWSLSRPYWYWFGPLTFYPGLIIGPISCSENLSAGEAKF